MNDGYVQLIEKEEMWALMLMQVLKDNGIPCAALPVYGAGFAMRTGMQEWLRVFVPARYLQDASELADALFSEQSICIDE